MPAMNINLHVGCEGCTFADSFGRNCQHGLLTPVLLVMTGQSCPDFKPKTTEQLELQYNEQHVEFSF